MLEEGRESHGLDFKQGSNEKCAFYDLGRELLVLTYVDDVYISGPKTSVEWFIRQLNDRFACKSTSFLTEDSPIDFIGMVFNRGVNSLYIDMSKYIETMWTTLNMKEAESGCRTKRPKTPISAPIVPDSDLTKPEAKWLLQALGMIGWLSMTTRLDLRYSHSESRLSQHLAKPTMAVFEATVQTVRCAYDTKHLVIEQKYSQVESDWKCYSDSDHAGNSELQNKRRSQLSHIIMNGGAPIAWASKASGVQLYDKGFGEIPRANPRITDLHADLSSAAAEIYAAGIACYEVLHMQYISRDCGIEFPVDTPVPLYIDNTTAIAFASNTIQRSKLRHIDCSMEWVLTLRDARVVKPTYVHTDSQLADLGTKILSTDKFQSWRDQLMCVRRPSQDDMQVYDSDDHI